MPPGASPSSSFTASGCWRRAGTGGRSVSKPRDTRPSRSTGPATSLLRGSPREPELARRHLSTRRGGPRAGRHRGSRQEADRHRPLLRRAARADHRRPWPCGGDRLNRSCAQLRSAPAAVLDAQGVPARARQPAQLRPDGHVDIRAVQVRVRERGPRGGGARALRDLPHACAGAAVVPGRYGELEPVGQDQGSEGPVGSWADARCHRRQRQHRPVRAGERRVQEAAEERASRDRAGRDPGRRSFAWSSTVGGPRWPMPHSTS